MKKNSNRQTFILALNKAFRDCFQNCKCNTPQAMIMIVAGIIFSFICQIANGQPKSRTESWEDNSNKESYTVTYDTTIKKDGSTETCTRWVISGRGILTLIDSCTDHQTGYSTIYKNVYWTAADGKNMKRRTLLGYDPTHKKIYEEIQTFYEITVDSLIQIGGFLKKGGKSWEYDTTTKKYSQIASIGSMETTNEHNCCYQPNEIVIAGNYLHAGDEYYPYNAIGGSGEFTKFISPDLGITADAGIYIHSQPLGEITRKISQLNIAAGVTYLPFNNACCENKFSISTHALFGISNYTQTTIFSNKTVSNTLHSVMMDIGAAAKWKLNNEVSIVLPQIDYAPTLFGGNLQNNLRIGLGASISFGNKICYESKTEGLPMTMEKGLPTVVEEDSTDEEEMPKPPPTWSEIAIKGYDFEEQPGIYSPNDRDHQNPLNNPHRTKGKNCSGIDIFDYSNGEKPGIATLVIKNEGECKVHVKIEKLSKGNGKNKKDKNSGTTDDKNGEEKNGKGKVIGQKAFEYDVDKMPGSDVFSFKIDKETSIRVIITCGGGDGECIFTRNFSIATENETPITKEKDAPRLKVDPPSDPEQLTQYKPQGNRCTSRDSVFFKITNHDVKETMTIHFKAVTSCSCYFEVYADGNPDQPDGDPNPKEGSKVGFGDAGESEKIAKPSIKDQPAKDGTEQVLIVKSGETYYLKGRCPVQLQKSGPCNGHVEITGITFTTKKK